MGGLDHAHSPGDSGRAPWQRWGEQALNSSPRARTTLTLLTVSLMAALFAIDVLVRPPISVAALYGFAVLLAATYSRTSRVVMTAAAAAALTCLAYYLAHATEPRGDTTFRFIYGLALQAVALLLVLRGMMTARMLASQAKLLDQTHDSVVLRRVDGRLLYWNRGAVDLFGYTFEEARRPSQAELIATGTTLPPMPLEEFIVHGPWRGEVEVRAKDGRRMVIDCSCSLLLDERERPYAVLTTGNDVTRQHEAQERLQRSETRYRNIFQTTGIGIWELNLSGVRTYVTGLIESGVKDLRTHFRDNPNAIRGALACVVTLDVNDAGTRMLGGSCKSDMLGPHDRWWPDESLPKFAEALLAGREDRPSVEIEPKLNTLDGRKIDCLLSVAYPPEAAPRESVFVTITDITNMTAAATALRMAQADLAHASRLTSLGELAASIAHEVKQPVAGILANGQAGLRWLRRDPPDLEAVSTSLTAVVSESKRVGAIITGLRALAQNHLPNPTSFSLPELVEETLRLVATEVSRNGVSAKLALDHSQPTILADRVQIQQVLINLVLNAVQAMGDVPPSAREVGISVFTERDHACVSVSDSGPGIAPALRSRLFTAFNSSRSEGMGLGLSICATIIARHEGIIALEERSGAGARFVFCIPFRNAVGECALRD